MKRSIKILIIVWILVFIFETLIPFVFSIFSSLEESTGPNDYARITDIDYKAVLVDEPNEGGKVVITEQITFDIHAASQDNLFWELWRDLPEDYVDGLKIDYQVNYVKQINDDGTETYYEESPKLYWEDSDYTSSIYGPGKWYHSTGPYSEDLRNYECVFFYVDGLYRGEITFEIQYEMNNAALRYADVSELYLTMYSEDTIKYLKSFNGQVLIPEKDMPKEGYYLAHTYGTNSNTFEYTESDTLNPSYHTFSFSLDEDDLKFKSYNQYLEFSLLSFDVYTHIFTDYAPDNLYSDDNYLEEALVAIEEYDQLPDKYKTYKTIFLSISIGVSILILISTATRDKKIRKKHNFYTPIQTMQYFREIPSDLDPHFAATLTFSKNNHKVNIEDSYSALMLNLIRKEYIELQKINSSKDWTFNNITINILYDSNSSYQSSIISKDNSNNNISEVKSENNTLNTQQANNSVINQPVELRNINGKVLEKLSPNEESYFNLIIRHSSNNSITMKNFQQKVSTDYDNTDTFVTSIEKSIVNIGISQGYFQKSDYNGLKKRTNFLSKSYIIFGLLMMTIGNLIIVNTRFDLAFGSLFILGAVLLICGIYLKRFVNKYVLLTQLGEDEYVKWKALYDFLNSQTLMKDRTVIELPLWEKYLVYATAFGISNKVIKALKIRCPDVSNSPILSGDYYYSSSFRRTNHLFRTATRSASSTSRIYRYSVGSYYGGGGRGGGGGGGGH